MKLSCFTEMCTPEYSAIGGISIILHVQPSTGSTKKDVYDMVENKLIKVFSLQFFQNDYSRAAQHIEHCYCYTPYRKCDVICQKKNNV